MKILYNALWMALLFFFVLPQPVEAQRHRRRYQQRFKAGLLLGGNLSQVDGDRYSGFDKANLQFGVSGAAIFSEHVELGIEFLYAGRGSRVESDKNNPLPVKDRLIDLRYMEVPILFRYKTNRAEGISSLFELGFAFGRIIRAEVTEPALPMDGFLFRELEPDFNKNELSLLGSYGIRASRHLLFKFRLGLALTQFYDNQKPREERPGISLPGSAPDARIRFLRNYYMALMVHYQF